MKTLFVILAAAAVVLWAAPASAQCPGGCRGACPFPGACGSPGCNCGAARAAVRFYLIRTPGGAFMAVRAFTPALPAPRRFQALQQFQAPFQQPFRGFNFGFQFNRSSCPGGVCPPGR